MDWKEFFKPTLAKIVLFFLMPFIFGGACNAKANPCPLENTIFSYVPLVLTLILWIISIFYNPYNEIVQVPVDGWRYLPIHYLIGFLSLIINYLIACSLVFFYFKIKRK